MAEQPPVSLRRTSRPRIRRRWLLLWGLVVISGSMLASITLHSRHPADGGEMVYRPPAGADSGSDGRPVRWVWSVPGRDAPEGSISRVALRSSAVDRRTLTATGGDYDELLSGTRAALIRLGTTVRDISALTAAPGEVLFLDHAYCLSEAQWDSVRSWVETGGALAIAGPLGVRDEMGEWVHWDRMRSLLDVERIEERWEAKPAFLTLGQGAPMTDPALQGFRLSLDQGTQVLGFPDEDPLVYWSDYFRAPVPDPGASWAAATARVVGEGRVLWLGFPLGWIHEEPENDAAAAAWLQGMLAWCAGDEIQAALELWPGGAEAAVLLAEDSEDDFGQVHALAQLLDRYGLPGTFLCVSDEAGKHPDLLRTIAARHEIGSHTDDHRPVEGEPYRDQKRRLERSARTLEELSGTRVTGFRPPEERFDEPTLRAMAETGYEYLLGHSQESWAFPRILEVSGLVQIPRLIRDDYNYTVHTPTSSESVAPELSRDLDLVRRFHGVGFFSFHTHLLGHEDRIHAVEPFIASLPDKPVWAATGAEVANWVLNRSLVEVEVLGHDMGAAYDAQGHIPMRIRNTGEETLEGLVLTVVPGWDCESTTDAGASTDAEPAGSAMAATSATDAGASKVAESPGSAMTAASAKDTGSALEGVRLSPVSGPDEAGRYSFRLPPLLGEDEMRLILESGPGQHRRSL